MEPTARRRGLLQGRYRRGAVGAVVVVVLLAVGVVWLRRQEAVPAVGSPQPSPSATPSAVARVASVTYEVGGSGRATIQYLETARFETITLANQPLPWRVESAPYATSFVQITARRIGEYTGADPVRALVDGVEVCSGTDNGGYMQSTCSELVPPR